MSAAVCALHGIHPGQRCPACANERARRPKPMTAARRIRSGKRWKLTVERILARDGHRCTYGLYDEDDRQGLAGGSCRATRGLDVHHRVPIEDGGDPYDDPNLRTLCDRHHAVDESRYRRAKETDSGEAEF